MIKYNYKEALNQAKELDEISEELKRIVNRKLKPGQSELRYAWRGDSAQLFLQKTEELFKDISKSAKITAGVAKSVETTAKVVKAAEEAAEKLVRTVTS